MTDAQLKKLEKYLNLLESTPEATLLMFEDMETELFNRLSSIEDKINNIKPEKGDKGDKGDDGLDGKDGENYILTEQDKKEIASTIEVPVVEKIIERTEVIKEQPIVTQEVKEVAVKDTGEEIVKKINELPIKEKFQIGWEHIKGLKKLIEQYKTKDMVFVGSGNGGRVVKSYDISSSLDGSTKTFSLPAFYRILSVELSSFPHTLRPTTDYTTDANAMTITFTSQIDETLSLATGQTCIILYAE